MLYQSEQLKRLLNALRKYCTAARGNQSFIALACSCSPSTVSDWLHARKNPTGEQVLSILSLLGAERGVGIKRGRKRKMPPKSANPAPSSKD